MGDDRDASQTRQALVAAAVSRRRENPVGATRALDACSLCAEANLESVRRDDAVGIRVAIADLIIGL